MNNELKSWVLILIFHILLFHNRFFCIFPKLAKDKFTYD